MSEEGLFKLKKRTVKLLAVPLPREYSQSWRKRYADHPDFETAKAVRRLLMNAHNGKPESTLDSYKRQILKDEELSAFFKSCFKAGEDAWRDEIERVRNGGSSNSLPFRPVLENLDTWRSWGRMLIENEV
ncbi:conserved hypothetical protein [Candidatus Terasakiella magnetica]|uniref:Uncharacterized protein n=1 Tax=Candidatus Terasakiella magnetica TaxID=1867952 RepID=A0A1C3RF84_9PROT|nr:hypothetical protein [Candidatus Terasakiella magnetica]SCA55953.1 conserved hypothetical protein [Candidatus Terasakiella magnetica]